MRLDTNYKRYMQNIHISKSDNFFSNQYPFHKYVNPNPMSNISLRNRKTFE